MIHVYTTVVTLGKVSKSIVFIFKKDNCNLEAFP